MLMSMLHNNLLKVLLFLTLTLGYSVFSSIILEGSKYEHNQPFGTLDQRIDYIMTDSNLTYKDTLLRKTKDMTREGFSSKGHENYLDWVVLETHLDRTGEGELSYHSLYVAYLLSLEENTETYSYLHSKIIDKDFN